MKLSDSKTIHSKAARNTCLLAIAAILISTPQIYAQHLEVHGHGNVIGNLSLCHMEDSSSLNIGVQAGINTDYTGQRGNTFVGSRAGFSNTSGASNTFIGAFNGEANTTGVSNTFVGYRTGSKTINGAHNSFFGTLVGAQNSSGSENSFFGSSAGLLNTTGGQNSFFGSRAGFSNTAGFSNSFFGADAGFANSGGIRNSFFGEEAGRDNTDGELNCFFGHHAGRDNKQGNYNVYVGTQAGQQSTSDRNVFVGYVSGEQNLTGQENVFIGASAGRSNGSGSQNTIIGTDAITGGPALENAVAIGYKARVDASNKVRIGNTDITKIEGQVPFSFSSDERLKEAIQPAPLGLNFIADLNPVIYHRRANHESDKEMGLIAQELQGTLEKFGVKDAGLVYQGADGYYSVRYTDLFAPMIKAIQQMNARINLLEQENIDLREHIKSTADKATIPTE